MTIIEMLTQVSDYCITLSQHWIRSYIMTKRCLLGLCDDDGDCA